MDATLGLKPARRGFTLIEMLAVVVIIGILAALITAAAIAARNRARKARIKIEIDLLQHAIQRYVEEYGEFPPDFTDDAAVTRHLRKAFQKCPASNYPDFSGHSPASALVYWLNGPDGKSGFSANVYNPFDNSESRKPPLCEFDQTRLRPADPDDPTSPLLYYPNIGIAVSSSPYVYFKARKGGYGDASCATAGGEARPYYNVSLGDWVNPKKFQIICAGLDDRFGAGTGFPTGEGGDIAAAYEDENWDNITNFSDITLEDDKP